MGICEVDIEADFIPCLLYTSDAADERSSVDLGGRRIIKKKKKQTKQSTLLTKKDNDMQYARKDEGKHKR